MNNVIYYIQHAVSSSSSGKVSIANIIPVFLPITGVLILWPIFAIYRGQRKKIIGSLVVYLIITMIIPLALYSYSAYYLGKSSMGAISTQLIMFFIGLVLLIPLFNRFSYKTDGDYAASKPRINNSDEPVILFPNKIGATLVSWYFVLMFIGFILFGLLWLYASNHHCLKLLPFAITLTCIFAISGLLFYVFIRLFPRCPYCKFGLLDMDFRYNPPTQEEKNIYTRQFYKTLWNVLRLKPFSCRYCKAPFVLRKQDL